MSKKILLGGFILLIILVGFRVGSRFRQQSAAPVEKCPTGLTSSGPVLMLWAWERPEDLRFLNPNEAGVAFLAATVNLGADEIVVHPRRQPLKLNPGTFLMGVMRIETEAAKPAVFSEAQRTRLLATARDICQMKDVRGLQIDFDAKVSERSFYRQFLLELRAQMPPGMGLTITSLASWCMFDDWMTGLPVDEVVPMIFRMGADTRNVLTFLAEKKEFRSPKCRCSIGIADDEFPAALPRFQRLYVFSTRSWNRPLLTSIHQKAGL
ncbi:MAG: DUF3142 domain-containing protein [Blastocatellia bacterium]|nr:DUF3142 domain-containing protein [Blastocatellia bacterium]